MKNLKNLVKKESVFQSVVLVICVLLLAFILYAIGAAIFMVVVNWVSSLFSLGFALTYWQSFGVYLLLSIIGSFFKSTSTK